MYNRMSVLYLKNNYGKIIVEAETMNNKEKYTNLRDEFSQKLAPKNLEVELTAWEFYINSTDENRERFLQAEDNVQELFKDEDLYNEFLEIEKQGLNDKHLDKQLKDLVKCFDEELNVGALKKELREKENSIAAKYNKYVPQIDGKDVTKAEITKILESEKDPGFRKKAYDAKVKGGDSIAQELVELIKMRNEFAKTQGYENFYDYQLKEEYDVESEYLSNLLHEVYENVKQFNKKLQTETKEELAQEFGINVKDLKSYHYGLILKSNPAKEINKSLTTKEQVVEIAKQTYKNMGFDIDNMNITLDLFPRKNKNTHGFCFEIEPGKDSRILANLTNNIISLETIFHELGHCIYNLGISTELPYLDRGTTPAMTEAVAMMMGDLIQTENVLQDIVSKELLDKYLKEHKKTESKFINIIMLIISFEKEMYLHPDQNPAKLWHDLKCIYLGRNQSEELDNEWATIPHYLSHPAYYQNYFRANVIKAQMYNFLTQQLGAITENNNTAKYLNENLFKYGKSVEENDMIELFTQEPLSAKSLCNKLQQG